MLSTLVAFFFCCCCVFFFFKHEGDSHDLGQGRVLETPGSADSAQAGPSSPPAPSRRCSAPSLTPQDPPRVPLGVSLASILRTILPGAPRCRSAGPEAERRGVPRLPGSVVWIPASGQA